MIKKIYVLYDRENDEYVGAFATKEMAEKRRKSHAVWCYEEFGYSVEMWLSDLVIYDMPYTE